MSIDINLRLRRDAFTLDAQATTPPAGITAISGPSGAGKTTLLRAIAGLERAQGHVHVGTQIWQDENFFMPVHQRGLGYVFQESSLFAHLNVRRNLEYGLRRTGARISPASFAATVELLGLADLLERDVTNLSGGERQRVAIGRALLTAPGVLLMDEPLASLDRHHKHELLPYLEQLRTELQIPILYVSHAADEIARLADYLILMDNGHSIASGDAPELLTRLDLPAAHAADAAAVITATVSGYDHDYGLSELLCGQSRLFVPSNPLPKGRELRLRVLPRDVSLTLQPQQDTSILNILPARVVATTDDPGARRLVRLDADGQPLLAQITRKSADALGLQPGKQVYAQIKTVALLN